MLYGSLIAWWRIRGAAGGLLAAPASLCAGRDRLARRRARQWELRRRVTAQAGGREQILGIAYGDWDVVEFARRVGIEGAEDLLDDPDWVRWEGEGPHVWGEP